MAVAKADDRGTVVCRLTYRGTLPATSADCVTIISRITIMLHEIMVKLYADCVHWIPVAQDSIQWRPFVNTVVNLRVF
jgi:hypothetical protein